MNGYHKSTTGIKLSNHRRLVPFSFQSSNMGGTKTGISNHSRSLLLTTQFIPDPVSEDGQRGRCPFTQQNESSLNSNLYSSECNLVIDFKNCRQVSTNLCNTHFARLGELAT